MAASSLSVGELEAQYPLYCKAMRILVRDGITINKARRTVCWQKLEILLLAIARHNHVVAVQPQACLDQIADRRLIIDHQNPLTTLPNRYCALGHQDLWKDLQGSKMPVRGV